MSRPEPAQAISPDELLRAFGFVIHARPRSGPVLWKRGKYLYTQRMAQDFVKDRMTRPRE